jgi:hypothetical protein
VGGVTKRRDDIEFAEPSFSRCDCCGGTTTRLTRFVTREDNAFAVYFANFSEKHADRCVSVLVGFGDWSEDASPNGRTAVALRIWTDETSYQVGVVDGCDYWETDFLGQRLTREQALESEWLNEAFDLSDHIVECDLPVIDYLNRR